MPAGVLAQLSDLDRDGTEDPGVVDAAIVDAEAEVNSYLQSRYSVPLAAPVPSRLRAVALDVTTYRLFAARGLSDEGADKVVRQRYEDALRWLRDVAAGRASLPLPGGDARPAMPPRQTYLTTRPKVFGGGQLDDL